MSRSGPTPDCIGKCKEFQAQKPSSGKRYFLGQKRCQSCEEWLLYEGVFCPCCKQRLRTKPKSRKNKVDLARI